MIVTIEAGSADELRSKIMDLAGMFGASRIETPKVALPDFQGHAEPETPVVETKAKKSPGRPKKAAEKESVETVEDVVDEAPTATREQAMAALVKVNAKDKALAKKILSDMGFNRFSELTSPKQYGALVAACEAAAD